MAFIFFGCKPRLLNSPQSLNSSWCVHLECNPSISLLIDPRKGRDGQQPTQWWMEVHVALRKDFCSHALNPCMEKLRLGWWGLGVWGKVGVTFSLKKAWLSLSYSQLDTL